MAMLPYVMADLPYSTSRHPLARPRSATPARNRHFQRAFRSKKPIFPLERLLRGLPRLILSGPTDPRFQGETSSVPHEEREHGDQKGR